MKRLTLLLLLCLSSPLMSDTGDSTSPARESITLGAGCFWCVEAVYERIEGITSAVSGYMGGSTENPRYKEVTSGTTGHAEVVRLEFDPTVVSLERVLEVFWAAHDPTTLNRQGADVGTQYRSAVFFEDERQEQIARASKEKAASLYRDPIVTEITPASVFYPAEDYHQEFYELNKTYPYCKFVIAPKLEKLGLD